jgi:hypothetical protein
VACNLGAVPGNPQKPPATVEERRASFELLVDTEQWFERQRSELGQWLGSISVAGCRDSINRLRLQARKLKEEHPLQTLAIIAGGAFLMGIAARNWRYRSHGR